MYFKFFSIDFCSFFQVSVNEMSEKILEGHRACLEDIVQNTAKMGVFCLFSEGSVGWVLQKLSLIEQISI